MGNSDIGLWDSSWRGPTAAQQQALVDRRKECMTVLKSDEKEMGKKK